MCCTVQVGPYTGLDTKLALPRAKRTLHALPRLRTTFSMDRRIRTIPCTILCFYIFETMVNNGHSNFNFEMIRNFKTVKISNGDFRIYIFSSFRAIGNEFQSVTMPD